MSRADLVESGHKGHLASSVPDLEVPPRANRRRFSSEYKLLILAEAEACTRPAERCALLRGEGLYSSHLNEWRRQGDHGALDGLPRDPTAAVFVLIEYPPRRPSSSGQWVCL